MTLVDRLIEIIRHDPWITATNAHKKVKHLNYGPGTVAGTLYRLAAEGRLVRVKNSWGTYVYNLP